MSLLRALPRTTAPLCRARFFSNSPLVSRSVFEGTKDAIKAGHDAASQTLVKGIEVGGMFRQN